MISLGANHPPVIYMIFYQISYLRSHYTCSDYGKSSQTVVTDAKHMGKGWRNLGNRKSVNGKSVGDFVKAGGKNYNVVTNNCHDASRRMDNLGKRRC